MSCLLISTLAKEGTYESAKWLKWQVLAGGREFEELFSQTPRALLYSLGSIRKKEELLLSRRVFTSAVEGWASQLKEGFCPSSLELREVLACGMTMDTESLWLQQVGEDRFIVKVRRPIIQMQAFYFSYSSETNTFHSMSLGSKSVFWGIQFSYPQIFMDPVSGEICQVGDSFANTGLMKVVRQWIRDCTLPAAFIQEGRRKMTSMRWGRSLSSWIANHPQFSLCGLQWLSIGR